MGSPVRRWARATARCTLRSSGRISRDEAISPKRAPALDRGVGHELLDQLVLGHLGHPHRVDGEADVLEVAAGHHDAHLAAGGDGVQVLDLLRGAAARRRVDDAAQSVERAGGQLLDREVDVGAADVLVEQRGSLGQLHRVDVALQGADDRAFGEGRRLGARERLLRVERRQRSAERGGADARCGSGAEEAESFAPRVPTLRDGRIGHLLSPAGW